MVIFLYILSVKLHLYLKQSSATRSKCLMHLRCAYSQDTFRGSQKVFTCRSCTKKDMTYSFTKGRNLTVDETDVTVQASLSPCIFPCASCMHICLRVNVNLWCSDKGTGRNRCLPFVVVNVKCVYDFLNVSSVTCLHLRFI